MYPLGEEFKYRNVMYLVWEPGAKRELMYEFGNYQFQSMKRLKD